MAADPLLDALLDVVLSPALWLSVLLVLLYSVLFAVWRGAGFGGFLRGFLAALAGFGLGQFFGWLIGFRWLRIGEVQLLWGTLGAGLALVAVAFVSARLARRSRRARIAT